jgi:GTP cyclohydrolase II
MFTYLDPGVRERLVAQGALARIDGNGQRLDPSAGVAAGSRALDVLGPIPLPMHLGSAHLTARWYPFVRHGELARVDELATELRRTGDQRRFASLVTSMAVNSLLVLGEPAGNPLVRVHSSCLTGDVFGSERCECGPQLTAAIERIGADPSGGMLVYMAGHEGRGIGLWAKAVTYLLQDAGEDTYQANRSLGLPDDSRDYADAAAILRHFLGDRPFRLLTNNPKKVHDLARHGIRHVTRERHVVGVGPWNRRYLAAKRQRGHAIDSTDLDGERQ